MLSLERVSYKYPRASAPVIEGFSAAFAPGAVTAITGPNGCGKTTLTKLLAGILRPASGRVLIDGRDAAGLDIFQIGRRVGYVFQNPARQLFCRSVYEEIAFGPRNLGLPEEEVRELVSGQLAFFRLETLSGAFPGTLSAGEKQRTALAAVLVLGTGYLVLDEPTSGLDMRGRGELAELLLRLAGEGRGIVLVSHESAFLQSLSAGEVPLI